MQPNLQKVEPKWSIVTGFIDVLKRQEPFAGFSLIDGVAISIMPLDYLDDGVDLYDQQQLFAMVYGAMMPLRGMLELYAEGDLPFEPIAIAYSAFRATLSSLKTYLPPGYFAPYYDQDEDSEEEETE